MAGFATKSIHSGRQMTDNYVVQPLIMTSTFLQNGPNDFEKYCYGRDDNPNRYYLENCLATLENAKYARVFSSGTGATTALMSLLKSGDHIVSGDSLYGGTHEYFQKYLPNINVEVTEVDARDHSAVERAVLPNTKMIWLESPTNPLMRLTDIKAVCDKVKRSNPNAMIVVDNTFLTCYYQKPLELGADVTSYSLTKYINGHSDVIMGAVVTNNKDIADKLKHAQKVMGIIPSPFDCSLVSRSLKTFELRMQQHMKNGLSIAAFLEKHPLVDKVLHPYMPSHPQYELSLRQTTGHSGMISIYIKGDSHKFLKALKVFSLAESLGGVESLAKLPYLMGPPKIPAEELARLKINEKLIRLSIGIETDSDLINDLEQALIASMK
ncbi:unnamed protein product [Trichogramma brassicae]|uniref:cystathionine gamma-lyase n=1 Tax=Trichogramma brassicae TaxID=86971 RepID=A0A6H5HXZ4_9HYME|nr:unnamed protein product [Trichogramma brassicae]